MHKFVHAKYPTFMLDFNKTWIFSTDFRKILRCQISWETVKLEPNYSMRTSGMSDGNTDRL